MPRAIQTEGFQADTLSFLERIIYRWAEIDKSLQLEIAGINKNKQIRSQLFLASPEGLKDAVMTAKKWNAEHFSVYFCPNPVRGNAEFANGKRPSDKDMVAAFYVFADADTISASAAIMECQDFCFRVTTGTVPFLRLHGYLELDQPITFIDDQTGEQSAKALENWRTKQQIIIDRFKTDPAIKNPSRLLRLPGFIAFAKNQTRIDENVDWERVNDTRVSADFFNNAKENIPLALDYNSKKLRDIFDLESRARSDSDIDAMLLASGQTGHWHNNVLRVVASLVGRGWSDKEIAQKCAPFCNMGASDPELWGFIQSARDKGFGQTKLRSDEEILSSPLVHHSLAIKASPFEFVDSATIPRRQWVYGHHLIRKFVSLTIAPGGTGKSSLVIAEALAMVSGMPLLGVVPKSKLRVWIFNAEDPLDELQRRVLAAAAHYNLSEENFTGLFLDSGRVQPICLGTQSREGIALNSKTIGEIITTIMDNKIDVLVIDPFISIHRLPENDNVAIDAVMKALGSIADQTNIAIELVHHSRKSNGQENTVDDARGASALIGAARSVRVINPMKKTDAENIGIENYRSYFRVDYGKSNLAAPVDQAEWYFIKSQMLRNFDEVGVVTAWAWPNAFDGVTVSDLRAAQNAVSQGGPWRENSQSPDWAGVPIARALGLDLGIRANKKKVQNLLRKWIHTGMFVVVHDKDNKRVERKYIKVDQWATD